MTDNRTTELLPCPFCGGEATVERIGKSGYYYVACNAAYCCDFGKFDTEAEAIAAWNTRADYYGYEQAAIEAWESIKAWNTRAELGSGTCEMEPSFIEPSRLDFMQEYLCSECGEYSYMQIACDGDGVNYCQNCGRKVVSA